MKEDYVFPYIGCRAGAKEYLEESKGDMEKK